MPERMTNSLQENLLALLIHDDDTGKVILGLLDPRLFEGDYYDIADHAVRFWQQHRSAPKLHMPDLLAHVIEDPKNRRANHFRMLLHQLHELAPTINKQYVMHELRTFRRLQDFKKAVLESAEKIEAQQEMALEDVENLWQGLLQSRQVGWDLGSRLSDVDSFMSWLEQRDTEFRTGIRELDVRNTTPARGTLLLYLGAAKAGKSWAMVHFGKMALLQRKKVLHISLEMPLNQVKQRYYSSLFSMAKRYETAEVTTFRYDKKNKDEFVGFGVRKVMPEFSMKSENLREELEQHLESLARSDNLVIKDFPMRSLSLNELIGYLDSLETLENFIPDLLIVDAPYLLRMDMRDYRLSLGRTMEQVRSIGQQRNMAVLATHQLSKEGAKARMSNATHVAEDWSLIACADLIMTFSRTDLEEDLGLGRLHVAGAREEAGGFTLLMSQNYKIGQYCIDSHMLPRNYFDLLKDSDEEESEEGRE